MKTIVKDDEKYFSADEGEDTQALVRKKDTQALVTREEADNRVFIPSSQTLSRKEKLSEQLTVNRMLKIVAMYKCKSSDLKEYLDSRKGFFSGNKSTLKEYINETKGNPEYDLVPLFESIVVEKVDFSNANISGCFFYNVNFIDCDFSGKCSSSLYFNVGYFACKFTKADFHSSNMINILIDAYCKGEVNLLNCKGYNVNIHENTKILMEDLKQDTGDSYFKAGLNLFNEAIGSKLPSIGAVKEQMQEIQDTAKEAMATTGKVVKAACDGVAAGAGVAVLFSVFPVLPSMTAGAALCTLVAHQTATKKLGGETVMDKAYAKLSSIIPSSAKAAEQKLDITDHSVDGEIVQFLGAIPTLPSEY